MNRYAVVFFIFLISLFFVALAFPNFIDNNKFINVFIGVPLLQFIGIFVAAIITSSIFLINTLNKIDEIAKMECFALTRRGVRHSVVFSVFMAIFSFFYLVAYGFVEELSISFRIFMKILGIIIPIMVVFTAFDIVTAAFDIVVPAKSETTKRVN